MVAASFVAAAGNRLAPPVGSCVAVAAPYRVAEFEKAGLVALAVVGFGTTLAAAVGA